MSFDVVQIEDRFQQLKRSRSALAEELRAAAMKLRTTGQIPSVELDQSLNEYQDTFGQVRTRLGFTPADVVPEDVSTWDLFQSRLRVCHQAAAALKCLGKVERLRMPKGFEATLDPVVKTCRELQARLARSPWNESELIQEIQAGRHPLCRVVSLVESLRDLSDDEWTTEMAVVQHAFGISVSTAIARGKISLADGVDTH